MKYIKVLFFIVAMILVSCASSHIAPEQYSLLVTPQDTFDFAKKTVAYNDSEAFYYCLSDNITSQVKLSDLKIGWSFAGNFFSLILGAKIKDIQNPAPEYAQNPNTAKVTIQAEDLEVALLLHKENEKWKIYLPSPYPLPDINKIKITNKHPWRTEVAYYKNSPSDWFKQHSKKHNIRQTFFQRKPNWRTE